MHLKYKTNDKTVKRTWLLFSNYLCSVFFFCSTSLIVKFYFIFLNLFCVLRISCILREKVLSAIVIKYHNQSSSRVYLFVFLFYLIRYCYVKQVNKYIHLITKQFNMSVKKMLLFRSKSENE